MNKEKKKTWKVLVLASVLFPFLYAVAGVLFTASLFGVFTLISRTLFEPSVLVVVLDLIVIFALGALFGRPGARASMKRYWDEFRRNL